MVPLKTVDKDPKVLNKELSVPGYVYIEVRVPVAEVSIMGENGPQAPYLSKIGVQLYDIDQSSLENVSHMFDWAYFNFIDLYGFNISKVKYVNNMIYCCYNLETIYCEEDFSECNFDNCSEMLYGNFKLTGHKGTIYNYEWATDNTYARPDGGESDPGYFSIKISV